MITATSVEAQNRFGESIDRLPREPISIPALALAEAAEAELMVAGNPHLSGMHPRRPRPASNSRKESE